MDVVYEDGARRFMNWTFDGTGAWEAQSRVASPDGEVGFTYRIVVCNDGTFDVSESDAELLLAQKFSTLPTLARAKAWCEDRDADLTMA